MNRSEIVDKLKDGYVDIVFEKVNGTTRFMRATLSSILIPQEPVEVKEEKEAKARKPNENALAVWDSEANGWRSFRWDKLREFNGVKLPNGVE